MRDAPRVRLVRARFGLPLTRDTQHAPGSCRRIAEQLHAALAPGQVALITGPSGSGKSRALSCLSELVPVVAAQSIPDFCRDTPVEMLGCDLNEAIGLLSAVGLGEARRMVTSAGVLSEGERSRLSMALAICEGRRLSRDVVVDEFASPLDALTARSLARCVRRAVVPPMRMVCATAHDEVAPHLAPDVVVYVPLVGEPELIVRGECCGVSRGCACMDRTAAGGGG